MEHEGGFSRLQNQGVKFSQNAKKCSHNAKNLQPKCKNHFLQPKKTGLWTQHIIKGSSRLPLQSVKIHVVLRGLCEIFVWKQPILGYNLEHLCPFFDT